MATCRWLRSEDQSITVECGPAVRGRIAAYVDCIEREIERKFERPIPSEINRLFESIDKFVARLYRRSCRIEIVRPRVYIDLGYLDGEDGDALDASCRLRDTNLGRLDSNEIDSAATASWRLRDADRRGLTSGEIGDALTASGQLKHRGGLVSITRLSVRDDAFDWPSACQLPYVLAHELVCHAYQGIAAPVHGLRVVADGTCAWTEGWMDVLAFWAAEKWLVQTNDPEWVTMESGTLQKEFVGRHARRVKPNGNLSNWERIRRMAAQEAVDHLLGEMRKFYREPNRERKARDRVYSFSLNLNALRMSQQARNQLLERLANALLCTTGFEHDQLIRAIVDFSNLPDLRAFERTLTSLSFRA